MDERTQEDFRADMFKLQVFWEQAKKRSAATQQDGDLSDGNFINPVFFQKALNDFAAINIEPAETLRL
ncbi:MAG: hypothetical protein ABIM40_00460 [Pseudomonadota bacterium]